MMFRLPKIVFALALIALAPALRTVLPSPLTSAAATPTPIHVIEHDVHDVLISVGSTNAGSYVGDQLVFSDPLYAANDKTIVGHDQGECVRTVIGKAAECFYTFFLAGGQVTVEGPYYDGGDSDLAVTGGTGNYVLARGQMHLHARNDKGTEYDCSFTLYTS